MAVASLYFTWIWLADANNSQKIENLACCKHVLPPKYLHLFLLQ